MPATAHPQPFVPQHGASVSPHLWVEQSTHAAPAVPQIASVLPVTHLSIALQQPMQILEQREGPPPSLRPASSSRPESTAESTTPTPAASPESSTAPSSLSATASDVGIGVSIPPDDDDVVVVASRAGPAASTPRSACAAPEQAVVPSPPPPSPRRPRRT